MTSVLSVNGVSVYWLTSGKVFPSWLNSAKRKAALKNRDDVNSLTVIQDFDFPSACYSVQQTDDAQYVIATGGYPPRVRIFELSELSLKCERFMDAPVLSCLPLSSDYRKLAFLQADRHVELHAAYGKHYRTRLPRFGRAMAYHAPTAELYVAATSPFIYRMSLEEGRFTSPLVWGREASGVDASQAMDEKAYTGVGDAGVNALAVSRLTALVASACDGGDAVIWDPRTHVPAARLSTCVSGGRNDATAIAFDETTLTLAVGTSDARVMLYDMRKATPLITKRHQYDEPIKKVYFHRGASKVVVSADSKIIKMWSREDGSAFANIETPAPLNDFSFASDKTEVGGSDTGLCYVGGETDRIHVYYVPQLGLAPKWASFMDAVTDEVDEKAGFSKVSTTGEDKAAEVYDDFRFVTRDELTKLGLAHLIGTPLLKSYMHGFFMDARLYAKVVSVLKSSTASADAVAEWRKSKIREQMQAERGSRIQMVEDDLPAFNRELAAKLRASGNRGEVDTLHVSTYDSDEDAADAGVVAGKAASSKVVPSSLLVDERFAKLFSDPDFIIDKEAVEYKLLHPTHAHGSRASASATVKPAMRDRSARGGAGSSMGGRGRGGSSRGGGASRGGDRHGDSGGDRRARSSSGPRSRGGRGGSSRGGSRGGSSGGFSGTKRSRDGSSRG